MATAQGCRALTVPDDERHNLSSAPGRAKAWPRLLLGSLILAAGTSVYATGSSLANASVAVVGRNVPVNAGAYDKLDFSAHNSPSVAQNPAWAANLVVVNRIDTPRFSCGLHVSLDGGATWRGSQIPFPVGEELPPRCFAPDVAFSRDGTAYISFVTLAGPGNTPNALWVVSSSDGGLTTSTPTRAAGPLAFQARLSADPDAAGRLYLSWLQGREVGALKFATAGNPIVVARSDDGGRTWGEPVQATPPNRQRVVAPSTAVGADGQLLLLYLDLRDDALDYHGAHEGMGGEPYAGRWQLVLARSSDRGASWKEAVVDRAVVPTERFIVFFPPSPSLAVDPEKGHVYAGFHDGRLGDPDVWMWASNDRGASFGPPVRVNDTPAKDGTTQRLPKVAVDAGGRVDVVYYDRRSDRSDVMTEASLQSSRDGGASFGRRLRLSDAPFDSRIGFGSERGLADLGSRLGLVSTDRAALAVWTDTRAGTEASNKQDLARAVASFSAASPLRLPLRAAGLAVAVAGAALVAWGLFAGYRRHRLARRSSGREAM